MGNQNPSLSLSTSQNGKTKRVFAILLALALGLGASIAVLSIPAADAASGSIGYGTGYDIGKGWIGSERIGGTDSYCVEVGVDNPVPNTADAGTLTSGNTVVRAHNRYSGANSTETITPDRAMRINYIIQKYGQTDDKNQGAAVQLAVWSYANPIMWAEQWGPGYTGLAYHLGRAPSAQRASIRALYNQFLAEANSISAPSGGSGSATIAVNMTNGYDGNVTVSTSPTNATGTLTVTGATINSNGGTSIAVTNGSVIAITGQPIDTDTSKYQITAAAAFTATVGSGYAQNIVIHNTRGQLVATAGNPGTSTVNFSANDVTTDPDITFSPVVSTVAPQFVQAGSGFTDTLNAGIANPTDPNSVPWRSYDDGTYVDIVTTGTLYGPFDSRPVTSATVPVGAPVVASGVKVTLHGPGAYSTPVLPSLTAANSGYYTWVWAINYADQDPFGQATIDPTYSFTDQFAQVVETSVVPIDLVGSTTVTDPAVGIFQSTTDAVTVSQSNGAWITEGGAQIPVTLTGKAYFQPGTTAPTQSATVPPTAVLLKTVNITTNSVGVTTSPPVTTPNGEGYVVWMWSISNVEQPVQYQGYFREWSDDYAVPSEVTKVNLPTVSTVAASPVAFTDSASDTALLNGVIPDNSTLTFKAYRQVVVGEAHVDATGAIVVNADGTPSLWTQTEIDALSPDALCLAQPVFSTTPLAVNAGLNTNQLYVSEAAKFASTGNYNWVETLHAVNPLSLANEVVSTGVCGTASETTNVSIATVTTAATPTTDTAGASHDTASVNGQIPVGATLTFDAYRTLRVGDAQYNADGTPLLDTNGAPVLYDEASIAALNGAAVCTPATSVFSTATTPVAVTAGLNTNAIYEGASTVFGSVGTYYWVEKLLDRDGNALHTGVCGEASEVSLVTAIPPAPASPPGKPPVLAKTGSDDVTVALSLGGITVLSLMAGISLAYIARRRKNALS